MNFKNNNHERFYYTCVTGTNSEKDPDRKALFYVLGLIEEVRSNIDSLYCFENNNIKFEGLNAGWQTGTSIRLCRLAFHLYNGFCGSESDEINQYTPCKLFECNTEYIPYMLKAIEIRYEVSE